MFAGRKVKVNPGTAIDVKPRVFRKTISRLMFFLNIKQQQGQIPYYIFQLLSILKSFILLIIIAVTSYQLTFTYIRVSKKEW